MLFASHGAPERLRRAYGFRHFTIDWSLPPRLSAKTKSVFPRYGLVRFLVGSVIARDDVEWRALLTKVSFYTPLAYLSQRIIFQSPTCY
jgi:hypothetical protein